MININKKIFSDNQKIFQKEINSYLLKMYKQLTSKDIIYGKSKDCIFFSLNNSVDIKYHIENGLLEIFEIYNNEKKIGFCMVSNHCKLFMSDVTATLYFINLTNKFFNKNTFIDIVNNIKAHYKRMAYKHFCIDLPIEYKDIISTDDGSLETNIYREYLL